MITITLYRSFINKLRPRARSECNVLELEYKHTRERTHIGRAVNVFGLY